MPSDGTGVGGGAGTGARYEPIAELARGGMASLQLARVRGPSGFTKYVVLKRILAKWADEEEFVEMFLDEARLAATLEHPNAVHVYDAGRDEEGPFFAMEYIHGEDLSHLGRVLRERDERLPLVHGLAIGIGIAAGLHHAHERCDFDGRPLGIIHRDVSPNNVLVTYEGGIKVVDFGIAKANIGQHATRPSVRKGKISFMSPEQCRGDALDRRSDVFSLGAVLYELLTGTRLFAGENEFVVMNRIVNHDAPRPSEGRPGLPAELDQVVARALARDPEQRYESARALQVDLEELALAQGLALSATALGDYLEQRLGPRPYPWAQAEAKVPDESRLPTRPVLDDEATDVVDRPRARVGAGLSRLSSAEDDEATAVTDRPLLPVAADPLRSRRWPWVAVPLVVGAAGLAWVTAGTSSTSHGSRVVPTEPVEVSAPPVVVPESPPSSSSSSGGEPERVDTIPGTTGAEPTQEASTGEASTGEEVAEPESEGGHRPARRRPRPRPKPTAPAPRVPFDPDGPAPRRETP